jgi:type IV secretory pathway TrbL component
MSNETNRPATEAGVDSNARPEQTGGATFPHQPEEVAEASPTGLQVTDSWADAADQTGTVKAKRQMPEPDSLGG